MPLPAGALATTVDAVLSEDGSLAAVLPSYEPREGQRRMAAAVAAVIEDGGTLLAEAGTGTGKTLAYLIPAVLSGQRLLVSTGTKNLQEQIYFKDVPSVRAALGVPFKAELMKGRGNYLCLHRWELYREGADREASSPTRLFDRGDRALLPIIASWLATTATGDRAELRDLPEDLPLWKDLAADAETCLGTDCPRHAECFVTLMRQRAAEADVVIVNHHLLCADAAVRQSAYGEVIPACPTLVVDEAHQLEDVATQYFGRGVSSFRVEELVRDVGRVAAGGHAADDRGAAPGAASAFAAPPFTPAQALEIGDAIRTIAEHSRAFFSAIGGAMQTGRGAAESRVRYTAEALGEHLDGGFALAGAIEGLEVSLALAHSRPAAAAAADGMPGLVVQDEAVASLERRAHELREELRFLLRADDPDYVYFLESRGRGLFLRAAPIDVSGVVRRAVLDRFRSVALTSATLAVDGSFSYVKGRLGIERAAEIRVPSEFDFAQQALLYLPRRMPPPKSAAFAESAARQIAQILERTRGRAFVLFTSYAVLRTVQRVLEMTLPFPLLVHGTAPRSMLIDAFRRTPNAVLLGTSSFWQGVDVAGDALSCVIIDKLPFASPSDPIVAARIDALRDAGRDAFQEYQVPLAILLLQQGLGRLLRHRGDRGVFAILDPRLQTMGYGRRFLASLPPAPVTHDLDAVGEFFK